MLFTNKILCLCEDFNTKFVIAKSETKGAAYTLKKDFNTKFVIAK